jgi:hypothetical protein
VLPRSCGTAGGAAVSAAEPVEIRLIGSRESVVARLVDLEAVFTVTDVFGPVPTSSHRRPELVKYTAFAMISRRFPVAGGGR